MTVHDFGAHAPITRRFASCHERDRAAMRLAWLLARIIRREPVQYGPYRRRFDRTEYGFRRDIRAIRDARIYRGSELLGSDA
ncbi:MAG TPA: hypothetical protein VHS78_10195 [Candidatus Elarobacter sp.]|jgi:hypothetical protein|nr:hypothetical protein [Candidatus Elarobacter sp.]